MLLLCKLLNADLKGYERLDHPVQKKIVETINFLTNKNILDYPYGVEGCVYFLT